jgi:hypothetical protein
VTQRHKLEGSEQRGWTRAEDYFRAMAIKRTARRARGGKPRTQPEAPRLLLSTLPFLALLIVLAVLSVAIMIIAFPGNQPRRQTRAAAEHEQGVAARGWYQNAEKEFHKS